MNKNITIASLLGGLAIILGAFGAHTLKNKLAPEALHSFETAVRYQIYHMLFVMFINLSQDLSNSVKNRISQLIFIGIFFFSGSIFAIYLLGVPAKAIWFITPLGGLCLVMAWFITAFYFSKKLLKRNR